MKLNKPLNKYIDHTILKHAAAYDDFDSVIQECLEHDFAMIAINSAMTKYCKDKLKGSDVHVGAAIGFPLGQTTMEVKVFETQCAIKEGADEIDYVVNLCDVKNGNYEAIQQEMQSIVSLCKKFNVICKVIFENCYLTKEEIIKLCNIASLVKPHYIKTSTGFGTHGARIEDVKIMRENTSHDVLIKASGGIRTLKDVMEMIEIGASRIGTSAGVSIMKEYYSKN